MSQPVAGDSDVSATQRGRRGILCADMDAMFASVEIIERGLQADALVIVGGDPNGRGVVATCSYSVRAFGVHSAMPSSQARRLCPDAIFLLNRRELYLDYSRRVMDALRAFGRLEQVSIDEAFVDVGAAGLGAERGRAAKAAVREATGLTCSVGLATNKLVAKIASGLGKPDGLTLVPPGHEAAFLAPMPVGKLWGVGPKTEARLSGIGVTTVGDLANLPLSLLRERFGEHHGPALYRHSRGEDDSEVITDHEPKQLSEEETFQQDVTDPRRLWEVIRGQAEELSRRLERRGLVARTVTLKLRYSDFTTITRSTTRGEATNSAEEIASAVAALIRANWDRSRPIRLLGIACSGLEAEGDWRQLRLLS